MNTTLLQEWLPILAPFFMIQLILMLIAIVAWYKAKQQHAINGNQWLWLVVIVLLNLIGPILFFIFGRRQN